MATPLRALIDGDSQNDCDLLLGMLKLRIGAWPGCCSPDLDRTYDDQATAGWEPGQSSFNL